MEWIKKHPLSRLPLLPVTAEALGAAAVQQIEECADQLVQMQVSGRAGGHLCACVCGSLVLCMRGLRLQLRLASESVF